jgi:protein-disulfide isomerase
MVYNCLDDSRLGGRTLIGTDPAVRAKGRGTLALLILAALTTILAGCGGAGSGDSSQPSAERRASETADPSGRQSEDTGSSERAAAKPLGHPALGSPDAPVVLTEYSDYQ